MRKKIDSRVRTLVENCMKTQHRSMFVIVGDKGRDQVVNLHFMLSKAAVKARPSVLWCYKKDLHLSRCSLLHDMLLHCVGWTEGDGTGTSCTHCHALHVRKVSSARARCHLRNHRCASLVSTAQPAHDQVPHCQPCSMSVLAHGAQEGPSASIVRLP